MVEILKLMLGRDSEDIDQDLCKNLWYELNPRVRCAFGNVLKLQMKTHIGDGPWYFIFLVTLGIRTSSTWLWLMKLPAHIEFCLYSVTQKNKQIEQNHKFWDIL